MDLDELAGREEKLKRHVKKNCLLCMGRSRLHTNLSDRGPEKQQVQAALKGLYRVYGDKYDESRKTNANAAKIMSSGNNKRIVLDIIEDCAGCDREIDRANRALQQLK